MCDLDYGYMGFTRNIIKIKGKTIQYTDMSIESACENENNVLLLKGKHNETHGITLLNGDKNTIENGVYIQNIGKIVLDGTQPLMFHGYSNDTYICAVYSDNSFDSVIYSSIYVEGEYKAISNNIMVPDSNKCGFNNRMGINKGLFMRFPISEVGVNIDQLNNYLKANNHIVYYKLVQPIYNPPNITNINLPQPLRSLPNGVCDEVVGNKLIQRVGKVIITKQDNVSWLTYTDNYYGHILFVASISAFGLAGRGVTMLPSVVCDKFVAREDNRWQYEENPSRCFMNSIGKIHFLVDKAEFPTITEFINWLEENPTTVYYELATPIEHTIDINIKKIKKSKCYNNIKPTII